MRWPWIKQPTVIGAMVRSHKIGRPRSHLTLIEAADEWIAEVFQPSMDELHNDVSLSLLLRYELSADAEALSPTTFMSVKTVAFQREGGEVTIKRQICTVKVELGAELGADVAFELCASGSTGSASGTGHLSELAE